MSDKKAKTIIELQKLIDNPDIYRPTYISDLAYALLEFTKHHLLPPAPDKLRLLDVGDIAIGAAVGAEGNLTVARRAVVITRGDILAKAERLPRRSVPFFSTDFGPDGIATYVQENRDCIVLADLRRLLEDA